ncbi:basic salivary proline-rich protein 2-like [Falco cherrug]|uniref:basic salivary proline-rich protein 2-like n=1 Tax=Falco cherrug TaxID=345164 RepID=UPI00247ACC53|nr:basic salivary proline-rich protein 2-like [Falco cherrug]
MSHSQFHCTGRVYLDMHGLSFETSICYWQDQPGSRHPRRARARLRGRPRPAGHAPPSLEGGDCRRAGSDPRRSGFTDATAACRRRPGPRETRLRAPRGGGRRRRSRTLPPHAARAAHRPAPGGRPFPRPPRARSRDRCAAFFFFFFSHGRLSRARTEPHLSPSRRREGRKRAWRAPAPRGIIGPTPTGADPPPEAGPSPPTHAPPPPATKNGCRRTRREGGRAGGGGRVGHSAPPPPSAAGAADVLEETATRGGGRDLATEAPSPGGAARSAAGRGGNAEAKAAAQKETPASWPAERGHDPTKKIRLSPFFLPSARPVSSLVARPPHRPCAARGRHTRGGVRPGPRPAPTPRRGVGPPENSQGHAAVTQPGFGTRKPREPDMSRARWGGGGGRTGRARNPRPPHHRAVAPSSSSPFFFAHGDTEGKRTPHTRDGRRIGKETTLARTPDATAATPGMGSTQQSRPAGGPLRRDPNGLIDQERERSEKRQPPPHPRTRLPGTALTVSRRPPRACG